MHHLHYSILRLSLPALVLLAGALLGDLQIHALLAGAAYSGWVLCGPRKTAPLLWWWFSLLASLVLIAQLLPGFTPRVLWPALQLSSDAPPYRLRLAWESLLVASTLLAIWDNDSRPRRRWPVLVACALSTLLGVPLLALALDVVDWQPKWPVFLPLWLVLNLCVTSLSEELIFRGWLQSALIRRWGAATGITLAALLFGAAHLPFSAGFAVVATLAGLGYGLLFHLGARLWMVVLLHGMVNLLHLLLLSYPLKLG